MKLFAAAYIACTVGAQSGDYADGDRLDYNYDDYGNKKNKQKKKKKPTYNPVTYEHNSYPADDGKYEMVEETIASDWAAALNCWPANVDADSLVFANQRVEGDANGRSPGLYPSQSFHNLAPQHVYGSFEVSNKAHEQGTLKGYGEVGLHEEDPVLRSGLGGLYQYGHDTYENEKYNQDLSEDSVKGTQWTHYKQARHAGCLYEKQNWHFGHDTFDAVFLASYYQGYGSFNKNAGTYVEAYETDDVSAGKVLPIWWHFFNAHVLPNPASTSGPTYPLGNVKPSEAAFANPATQQSIPLVMSNPTYEGLGYLNFIVEYKNEDRKVGHDYLEFIDSTPGLFTNADDFINHDTYREINSCTEGDGQECSGHGENLNSWNGVHGLYYYDLYMGSWLIAKAKNQNQDADRKYTIYPFQENGQSMDLWDDKVATWSMDLYDTQNYMWSLDHDLVVSSFPHNNLGKDFRFNLRLLMGTTATGGNRGSATSSDFHNSEKTYFYSYYFYKINQIDIVFPYNVAYALWHENRSSGQDTSGQRISDDLTEENSDWWDTFNHDLNHPAHFKDGTNAEYYEKSLDGPVVNPNPFPNNNQDYQFMHKSAADENKNIIPAVDLGTHAPSGDEFHRIQGYIIPEQTLDNAADWCDAGSSGSDVILEAVCGTKFYIVGLMNTYDERRGQRGSYQEVWVHLQYAMGSRGRDDLTLCEDNSDEDCTPETHPFQSPWPYNHFMANEIISIEAKCNLDSVNNPNTCESITFGAGMPNDVAFGGK